MCTLGRARFAIVVPHVDNQRIWQETVQTPQKTPNIGNHVNRAEDLVGTYPKARTSLVGGGDVVERVKEAGGRESQPLV